ncbi:MAG TPA: GNAT family protein [Blastocatellia bacterium]|nr:GNAT family protein [Blastocatellia bacterium]
MQGHSKISYSDRIALQSDQVALCRLIPDDAQLLVDWFNDDEIRRILARSSAVTIDQERSYLESFYQPGGPFAYGILPLQEQTPIGFIGLHEVRSDRRAAVFGIFIKSQGWRRRGLGLGASKLLLAYGFQELNLHRIVAITRHDNLPFQSLAPKLGFKREGRLRDFYFFDDEFIDADQFSLIAGEERV